MRFFRKSDKHKAPPAPTLAPEEISPVPESSVKTAGREKSGLFCFNPDLAPHKTDVEIIAVHGLFGDWEDTWTDEGTKRLWLRDFLPSVVPTARVWSYGYNSAVFSQSLNEIDLEARSLLDRINGAREDSGTLDKPIILVAHSLGGIVVKKALILAHEMSTFYGPLLNRVHAIVFLGVPHSGSHLAVWANFIARLVAMTPVPVNKAFITALQKNSSIFQEISSQQRPPDDEPSGK